jgi:hypothetical protein
LLDTIQTFLLDASLLDEFWAEAAKYAAYTRNRTPCGPQKKIPKDLRHQTEVHASHLPPFGCRAFYRDYNNTDKLHQCYREGWLLSYEEGTHNYHVWDPATKSVVVSRDVVFELKPPREVDSLSPSPRICYNHETRAYMEASDIISAVETSTPDLAPVEGQENDRPLSENNTSLDSGDNLPEQQYRGWE